MTGDSSSGPTGGAAARPRAAESRASASDAEREAAEIDAVLDRAVAGLPRWRRARTRRELAAYVEDALADLERDGLDAPAARQALRQRFGDPDMVAAGFRALPPPRWARQMRRSAGPIGAAVLGLVIGLTLVQVRGVNSGMTPGQPALAIQAQLDMLHVREVDGLQGAAATDAAAAPAGYGVASRLGVAVPTAGVLEPSLPALTPTWLPDGFDPARSALFLTGSATVQFFSNVQPDRPGIVVEVLRPDRSTVFQVKERHVFPVQVGALPGFYIDGEWEVRGPADEQPAPATWRTDLSHSLLFARDGLLVLIAGPADTLDVDSLLRIARSVH
jgi:hypothetical protein